MKHGAAIEAGVVLKSVLIVDDHPLYGEALAASLRHLFPRAEVATSTTIGEGLSRLRRGLAPDLVMLDLKLPDAMGVSGLLKVQSAIPGVPILVISALKSDDVVGTVMAEGAAGFVPKDAPIGDIEAAITEIASGKRHWPKGYTAGCATRPRWSGPGLSPAERLASLTPQHARIMRLICEGKQNKQIAYELQLAEATVKAHITALLRRLGVQNRTQAAVLAESALASEAEDGRSAVKPEV